MSIRIYTRSGDSGETGLFGGRRVAKNDLRVEAYGAVDELNAYLGIARAQSEDEELIDVLGRIQNDLLTVGSDLATPETGVNSVGRIAIVRVKVKMVEQLESWIDRFEAEFAPSPSSCCPEVILLPLPYMSAAQSAEGQSVDA